MPFADNSQIETGFKNHLEAYLAANNIQAANGRTATVLEGMTVETFPNGSQSVVMVVPHLINDAGTLYYAPCQFIINTPAKTPDGFTKADHAALVRAVKAALVFDGDDAEPDLSDDVDAAMLAAANCHTAGFCLQRIGSAEPENEFQTTIEVTYGIDSTV